MKMVNRHSVEGTTQAITIGQRVFRDRHNNLTTSRVWHAEYWVEGRQRTKSLKTNNKAAAVRNALAISRRLGDGSEQQILQKRVSIEGMVKDYLDMQDNQARAPKTMEKYRCITNAFMTWVKEQGFGGAASFKEQDFWAYRKFMAQHGKSASTQADHLILIKQIFKWAVGRGRMLTHNPLSQAHVKEPEAKPQPCFTPEQVEALLGGANSYYAPMFAFLAYAGLRFGELRALRWQDMLLDRGKHGVIVVRLGGSSGTTTKGGRSRQIPIHERLRAVIDALPRTDERVFSSKPSTRWPKGTPLNERTVIAELKELCAKLEFPNPQQYKLHTFRHAFASMCARNNVSYKYALQFMGHKNSDILDMYYTMFDSTAELAISTIAYGKEPAQIMAGDAGSNAA